MIEVIQCIKDECRFQNIMSKAVNQRFDCAYKTLDTVYSVSLIQCSSMKASKNRYFSHSPTFDLILRQIVVKILFRSALTFSRLKFRCDWCDAYASREAPFRGVCYEGPEIKARNAIA